MDLLRSCNVTRARIFENSDEEVWIRWYFTEPDAPAYPGVHAFGHPVWEDQRDEFPGAGVFYDPLIWRPNNYPARPTSFTPIGTREDFRQGLLFPPAPEAVGCGGAGIEAAGGACVEATSFPLRVVGAGVPGLYAPPYPLYRVSSGVVGGAVVASSYVPSGVATTVTGGGVPGLAVPAYPTYSVLSTVTGGGIPSSTPDIYTGAYSIAWDRAYDAFRST